jgi:hypothetical protein
MPTGKRADIAFFDTDRQACRHRFFLMPTDKRAGLLPSPFEVSRHACCLLPT